MKILYFRLIIVQTLFLIWVGHTNFYAQSTAASNAFLAGRFIGWTNTNGTNPLLFKTNNENRMKLNATVSYPVNGYAGVRNGYLLLGQSIGNNYSSNNAGAASLLHLNGTYNTTSQPYLGYRP